MGSPLSDTIAEVLLQDIENTYIKNILDTQTITFYSRYVDDILTIYSTKTSTAESLCDHINRIHSSLQFTPTPEENNSVSFLDLLLTRHKNQIEIDIYRKPTATDTTINFMSNRPTEHKMAAYRYLINRMTALTLTLEKRKTERMRIHDINNNNKFPKHIITRLEKQIQIKAQTNPKQCDKTNAITT